MLLFFFLKLLFLRNNSLLWASCTFIFPAAAPFVVSSLWSSQGFKYPSYMDFLPSYGLSIPSPALTFGIRIKPIQWPPRRFLRKLSGAMIEDDPLPFLFLIVVISLRHGASPWRIFFSPSSDFCFL